jgi:hypothetical protein
MPGETVLTRMPAGPSSCASARGLQRGAGGPGEQPGGAGVHREHPVPVLHRVLEERAGPVDAGVADDGVEPAEASGRLLDDARGRLRAPHVAVERQHRRAEAPQLLAQGVEPGCRAHVDRRDGRGSPLRARITREPETGGPSDAARRSRDQDAHAHLPWPAV